VYAAGNAALGRADGAATLGSVSFSHPVGDPGREDELIAATTARWRAAPHFIDIAQVPAIEPSLERARRRDEPFYHTYELWNRALALGCRAQGARVALNGNGGDPWFSTSPAFLADLLRQGRLVEFRREWRTLLGAMTWYRVFKVAIQPNLTPGLLGLLRVLRGGREVRDAYERPIPAWLDESLQMSPVLRARRRIETKRRPGEGVSALGRTWFLNSAFPERTNALVFSICQQQGVELRTPLLDNRIIQFAALRPRWESNSGRQNKHLLRRSMEGLLPSEVIAPRADRTGLPESYLHRTLRAHLVEARDTFTDGTFLAKTGIVDHRKLLADVDSFLAGRWTDEERAATVVAAVQAEWWLRTLL
jgi:Asparagine synthase